MMSQKQFLAALGFAFMAAWIGFNFGYAVLCLAGAALFYAAGSFAQGELDLSEIQDRFRSGGLDRSPSAYAAQPRPRTPRVR